MVITIGNDDAWLAVAVTVGTAFLAASVCLPRFTRLLARLRRPVARPGPPRPFAGKAFVIDGDTLHVGKARVRLFGIDAPELTQAGGWRARSHLIALAGGREVAVEPVAVDVYGRIVARVWLNQIDLSGRMVRDGFARGIDAWCVDYAAAEFEARRHARGLWASTGIADPAAHRRAKVQVPPRRRPGGQGSAPMAGKPP